MKIKLNIYKKISLAIILIVVILLVANAYFFKFIQPELDMESKMWVDGIVPTIVEDWNSQNLIDNSSSKLSEITSKEDIDGYILKAENTLGKFKSYKGSKGEGGIEINNFKKNVTCEYIADVIFENGEAHIYIKGIKENGVWKILSFDIEN